VDGKGKVWNDAIVIVRGDRIAEVTTDPSKIPAGAEVLDLRRYTAIPGLIDVHTHTTYYWDQSSPVHPFEQQGGPRLPAVTVFLAQENARRTLEAGVTTVRDLGANDWDDIAMRDLINRGAMLGPRMFVCGYGLSIPPRPQRPGATVNLSPGSADSSDEAVKAVRRQVAAGADVIKMYGSVGGFDNVNTTQTFTYDEMKAAVDISHFLGKKIAIHSYGPEGARDAVRAGADSLEHAVDIDDATLALMAKQGTYYVPTIDHNRYYVDATPEYQFAAGADKRLNAYIQRNFESARRAYKAGVKFAMGSDAVYTMFGQNTRELAWFVRAGMTPEEALKTATVNAADLLGKSADLGAATPGHFADLIAVEGDPLADVEVAIGKVRAVMKGGKIVIASK
jgi:imidazolonepropionase-like amidohydrolase